MATDHEGHTTQPNQVSKTAKPKETSLVQYRLEPEVSMDKDGNLIIEVFAVTPQPAKVRSSKG